MNVTKKKENESEWRIRVAIGETFDSVERKSLRPMSIAFILRSNWENEYFFLTIFWLRLQMLTELMDRCETGLTGV